MNRNLATALFACACQFAACRTPAPEPSGLPPVLRVELTDGSVLGLIPSAASVPVHTEYADMSIPWASVAEARAGTPLWTIRLRNGDQIRGTPTPAEFTGSGAIEKARIPYSAILSLSPGTARPAPTNAAGGPVRAAIRLRDGSSLQSTMAERGLRVRSAVLGTLELAPSELRSVEVAKKPAAVMLRSGDRIVGELVSAKIGAQTALGDMEIPVDRIASLLFEVTAGAAGLPDGLVAYYPFDEPGESIRDASGNGNDGKAAGARFVEEGAVGGCFEFRGGPDAGDFIRIPHSPSLVSMQKTREMTLSVWIRPRSIPKDLPVVVGKGGNEPPHLNGGYELLTNGNGDDDLHFHSNETGFLTKGAHGSLINSRMGQWIHVAIALESREDRASFAFYANAQRSAMEGIDGDHHGSHANFDIPVDLFIGGPDPRHHRNRSFFDGWIDEVMIFNRRLTADEIRDLYRRRISEPGEPQKREAADPIPNERPRPAVPPDLRRISCPSLKPGTGTSKLRA